MNDALVYGIPDDQPEPFGGIWLIWKHLDTGELLGPSVPFTVGPTKATYARRTPEGWDECAAPPWDYYNPPAGSA